ncbi:EthD family reductase [Rhizorhabdus wittichii]|uniref:EthD family reductase n=1 Tax=Rhizorhabdus wittichii TaxID=160791 RepID=UPI00031D63CB|nr:EthD family reductase [Rhizorhabdus wittichii]
MYMLAFLYPAAPGHSFDAAHWKDVHLPLGLGLTDKHLGIRPRKILLFGPGQGGDLRPDSAPHAAIAAVMFDDRESVERFATLFEFEEAARRLSADFPNYTAGPPAILVSEVKEVTDIDAMIERFHAGEAH